MTNNKPSPANLYMKTLNDYPIITTKLCLNPFTANNEPVTFPINNKRKLLKTPTHLTLQFE